MKSCKTVALSFLIVALFSACGGGGGGGGGGSDAPGDTTAPTVSSTSPANGSADVAMNSSIAATFSEGMDSSTINGTTFTLSGGSGSVSGTVTCNGSTVTFTPSSNLSYSTTYTATITTGAKDAAGNAVASNYTWNFTTGNASDTTPPTVSSTNPANNATGVAVNSAITVTFGEVMDASSITASTFSIGGVSGAVSYSGTTATFTPSSNLSYNTAYTVTVTTGVKDAAGNAMTSNYSWSFTTGTAPDTTPPTVSSTSPANNATGVAINSAISATFSETMDASTVTTSTFSLKQGTTPVSGTVTYSGTTAIFTPSSNLSYSTTYTATITTGVKDAAGNAMASNYIWSFTTGSAPDTTPPTVSSTSPASNATGVAINSAITATFSEVMDSSTVTTATFTLKQGTTAITGTVMYTGTTAIFTPSSNLSYSTTYTATITTGVKDAAGNGMASNYSWTFTTDTAPPGTDFKMPDTGQTTSYTTTFGEDHDYTINPPAYTDNGNGSITDNVTSLVWQKQDDGVVRTRDNAVAYCDSLNLGGQTDWRLPTDTELMTIVDYGKYSPSINTTYFPNTQSSYYWSSTINAEVVTSTAWYVNFNYGTVYSSLMTTNYYARCVRGGQTTPSFTDNGNGTVTDAVTTLVWQKQDDATTKTWEQALTYCEGLSLGGFTDWRLPNAKELRSIVDSSKYSPSINMTYFPNTQSSYYWSSTTYANNTSDAWFVRFSHGFVYNFNKTSNYYVRCVRGGQ